MKQILANLSAAILLTAGCSTGNKRDAIRDPDWSVHSVAEFGFSLAIPPDWQIRKNTLRNWTLAAGSSLDWTPVAPSDLAIDPRVRLSIMALPRVGMDEPQLRRWMQTEFRIDPDAPVKRVISGVTAFDLTQTGIHGPGAVKTVYWCASSKGTVVVISTTLGSPSVEVANRIAETLKLETANQASEVTARKLAEPQR